MHPLKMVLERAETVGPKGVVAFDLDSTLFDNLPRQVVILREFGTLKKLPRLEAHEASHWVSGWDMKGAMKAAGLSDADVEAHFEDARGFWKERFFTSAYCVHDVALAGAADYMRAVLTTGVQIAYLTGRQEEMRHGTVECMRRTGLPLPDGSGVHLLMKPTLAEDDDAFKRTAHAELGKLGTVVAAFDNEPTHANDYRRKFPGALVVRLDTDHSGRDVPLLDGVVQVKNFVL